MSLLEERIKRSGKNRPTPGTAAPKSSSSSASTPAPGGNAAGQTSPETRTGSVALRAPRPASAYYSSDNRNVRAETDERSTGSAQQPPPQARPVSGVFAMELEQTVQRAAGLRGNIDASIHIDLVQVNFDEMNEPVPVPRYK